MLSEHSNASLIVSKWNLQSKLWNDLNDAIVADFGKVKRIISAFIQFKGEYIFLREVQWKLSMHQPLIDNRILQPGPNGLVFSEEFRNHLSDIHRGSVTTYIPRPRF